MADTEAPKPATGESAGATGASEVVETKPRRERTEKQKAQFEAARARAYQLRKEYSQARKHAATCNDSNRDIGKVGVMPKRFTSMDI